MPGTEVLSSLHLRLVPQHGHLPRFRDPHQSLLNSRLQFLKYLLDRKRPRTMNYLWFRNLQSLLYLFQRLATDAMWKAQAGFLPYPQIPMPTSVRVGHPTVPFYRSKIPRTATKESHALSPQRNPMFKKYLKLG